MKVNSSLPFNTLNSSQENTSQVNKVAFVKKYFLYSLFLLPIGLTFGEVPTSVSEIIVFVLWLLSGYWKNISKLKTNIFFWTTTSLYFIHLFGLVYTTNFNYAFNDLRVKIPLLFFPVIFFTADIPFKTILNLLKWFVIVVFINLTYLYLYHLFFSPSFADTRNISLFISHIRLGLISAFAVATSAYIVINYSNTSVQKIFFIFSGISIILLMLSLGLITGIASLVITTFFSILYMIIRKSNRLYIYIISGITIVFIILISIYIQNVYTKYFPEKNNIKMYEYTQNGNPYQHNQVCYTENGYPVFINICDVELKKEWEKKSTISFDGKDKKNNDLKYTLYRYISSKGLNKDSAGLAQLSNDDIKNIENGNPNYLYVSAGFLEKRIYEFIQEYRYFKISKDPNGKTVILRLFYWKIALNIWLKNFLFGVGTGDVQTAFQNEYNQYSNINKNTQLRAHNQILTYALTFGIPGLIIILLAVFYPLIKFKNSNDYLLYFIFSIISMLSFFIDDTFETQPGVTFYALFNTLLIVFCKNINTSNNV